MSDAMQHVYDFYNAPIYQRQAWGKAKLAEIEHEINHGNRNRSADTYYNLKDRARKIRAELANTTEAKLDPMGYWFGRDSN